MLRLSWLTLYRCYQRYGISRLSDIDGGKLMKKKFKKYLIGYFHIDIAEVRIEQDELYLFVTICPHQQVCLCTKLYDLDPTGKYPRSSRAIW